MFESPGLSGGDSNDLLEDKSVLLQIADDDVIPNKRMKNMDPVEDDIGVDDDAVLEGEEEDLDQAELEDGNDDITSDDAAVDDVGESSDFDEYVQANLAHINDCQSEMERLNKNANDEILKVEQRYNQLRLPIYAKRNSHIDQIPSFWCTVFSQHPQLKRAVTADDMECLKHLTRIQISDFEDGKPGYQIRFFFSPNPWFSNSFISKEYHLPWHDAPSCACTSIDWYPGMDLTEKVASFFCWFCSQDDASTDDIAEIIKEELWPDPLQCYMVQPAREDGSDRGGDDGSDDEVEYVSSEDELAWEKQPALGKEVPGSSNGHQPYSSDEEEEEEELDDPSDHEDYDENDADLLEEKAEVSSGPQDVEKDDLALLESDKSHYLADTGDDVINSKDSTLESVSDEIQAALPQQSTDPGS